MRELDLEMTETRGIEFGQIPSHSKVTFSIPFTSDVDLSSLNVPLTVSKTDKTVGNRVKVHDVKWNLFLFPFMYNRFRASSLSRCHRCFPSENVTTSFDAS
jgi:hypothetical protein